MAFKPTTAALDSLPPGKLAPVPKFSTIQNQLREGFGKDLYTLFQTTIENLGRAVQLGQHRQLLENLSCKLNIGTLVVLTYMSLNDAEVCAALSVYLTTFEQTYHWPRDDHVSLPEALNQHKLVVQVLHQAELREMLYNFTTETAIEKKSKYGAQKTFTYGQVAELSLAMAQWMIEEARIAGSEGRPPLSRIKQDRVNLLYRTCRGDWFDQGSYLDHSSHLEFGGLHETIRTNGAQRRCQEIFEATGGLTQLQRMPALLSDITSSSSILISDAFLDIQIAVASAREELFNMMIDETIWGRTFAVWSKAVGFNNISAGGADCPMFRMLDALIGRSDIHEQAALLDELDFRSRFFPPNIRALVAALASAPSIRCHIASGQATYGTKQAFKALQQIVYDLYEMHRKKAMRIALSLRAGQTFTSSATQNAKSPESHIASTLSKAIQVRFGKDPRELGIDAYAWSSPLLYREDGEIEYAKTRFVLSTPLIVSTGDAIAIDVPMEPLDSEPKEYSTQETEWLQRTYTVTHVESDLGGSDATSRIATSIEVCIGNRGRVSSFLCSQRAGLPVKLSIRPSPHFRISENIISDHETVFVVQGGAMNVFLAWLAGKENLQGRYRLIIATKNFSYLQYSRQHLQEVTEKLAHCLRVVLCLSSPESGDAQSLLDMNTTLYNGRVTKYLATSPLQHPDQTTWYICGSSTFGMDVVRTIGPRSQSKKYKIIGNKEQEAKQIVSRLHPILTSKLPNIRMHVAADLKIHHAPTGVCSETSKGKVPRIISIHELALHNSPGDLWIAIDERVYDISDVPSFHPGGEKVLMYRAGLQAGDVFKTVHGGSYEVASLLQEMEIGQLAPSSSNPKLKVWEAKLGRIVSIQNDLANNSRFEQSPTGSPEQLNRAPPVGVIRKTLDIFVKIWISEILSESSSQANQLQAALHDANIYVDDWQSKTYNELFHNIEKCAEALRELFGVYYTVIGKIHGSIDEVKRTAFLYFEDNDVPDPKIIENVTIKIIEDIQDMRQDICSD